MNLTKSQEQYIAAVYQLAEEEKGARICDIAQKLSITSASASLSMKKLGQKGLVCKTVERHVCLTKEGNRQAVQILNRCKIIKKFLIEVLGVEQQAAQADAGTMGHAISPDTMRAIRRFVEKTELEAGLAENSPVLFGAGESSRTPPR
ncbi:MAG: metal-dependent transcriptional regulator [Oscillospiraceae bacterium]